MGIYGFHMVLVILSYKTVELGEVTGFVSLAFRGPWSEWLVCNTEIQNENKKLWYNVDEDKLFQTNCIQWSSAVKEGNC